VSVNLDEIRQPKIPTIGGRVRVTKSEYLRACPVGTTGILWNIGREDDGRPCLTIWRDDGAGFGWCEEVEPIEGDL
jgi:hypothetical protein